MNTIKNEYCRIVYSNKVYPVEQTHNYWVFGLFPSNREGGSLAGALFGGPWYVECADDISERAGDVDDMCWKEQFLI
jgi:hypothetical protein